MATARPGFNAKPDYMTKKVSSKEEVGCRMHVIIKGGYQGDGTLPSLVGSIFTPISHPFSPISLISLREGDVLGGGSLKRFAKK